MNRAFNAHGAVDPRDARDIDTHETRNGSIRGTSSALPTRDDNVTTLGPEEITLDDRFFYITARVNGGVRYMNCPNAGSGDYSFGSTSTTMWSRSAFLTGRSQDKNKLFGFDSPNGAYKGGDLAMKGHCPE
ncbi:Hypothetical Protein FCC1311_113492 [Hondaea fermentalgiana]|uniref:Uncharacterized protein n=1 Tax=Hondaea fermentalgiana TaxID=2315210 RepID=A0A2R5GWB2_9STRA|nr:Hypothetical Protein FCC1311_113492 [Hondaea fermentalgiana]|eukprot:GBG35126.1 Hypothetical Protein FCC1311_113492 [Hondaea fermentalgiana]